MGGGRYDLRAKRVMERGLQALGIAVGVFAVIVQFWLAVGKFTAEGMSLGGAVVAYFSFFTILTNIFAVLVHASAFAPNRLDFFMRPRVQASAVVAATVVCIIYHFLLAQLWNPQGMQYVTDVMLHYVAPVVMLIWWLGFGRTGALRWGDIPVLLAYPLVYLAYVLVRAPIAGTVPYPFLDYWTNGWSSVVQTIIGILILFIVIALLTIAADRFAPKASGKFSAS